MSEVPENDQAASVEPARTMPETSAPGETYTYAPGLLAPARPQSKGLSFASFQASLSGTSGESSASFARLARKDPAQSSADTLPLPRLDAPIPRRRGRDTTLMAAVLAILITVSGVLLGATTYNGHSTPGSSSSTAVSAQPSAFPFSTDLLLNDSLANASHAAEYGWTVGSQCIFAAGAYHVLASEAQTTACLETVQDLSDFSIQVQMTITGDGKGGLIWRKDPQANNYYVLYIDSTGKLDLLSVKNGAPLKLLGPGKAGAGFHAGEHQSNKIAVTAHGNWIAIFVNGTQVFAASDGTYTHGQLGFVASASSGTTDIAYNNVQIWKL